MTESNGMHGVRIVSASRLQNSRNGNPTFSVRFDNGVTLRTARDASIGYDVENNLPHPHRGILAPVLDVELTNAGLISYWRVVSLGKVLPDTQMYAAMRSGHANRKGHALVAHLESTDDGETWNVVRTCCE